MLPVITSLIAVGTLCQCIAQGTFQNLAFESASLVSVPGDVYGRVQFVQAFPGWVGFVGTNQEARALYNNYFLDTSGIAIIDDGWTNQLGPSRGLIEGNFTAILQAGFGSLQIGPADTSIVQTGLVPSTAQSLLFKAQWLLPGGSQDLGAWLAVTLGGQQLSFMPIASGTNFTMFGADIHQLAGQTAALNFTLLAQRPHQNNAYLFLDSIEFSQIVVPEPSMLTFFVLIIVCIAGRYFFRRGCSRNVC